MFKQRPKNPNQANFQSAKKLFLFSRGRHATPILRGMRGAAELWLYHGRGQNVDVESTSRGVLTSAVILYAPSLCRYFFYWTDAGPGLRTPFGQKSSNMVQRFGWPSGPAGPVVWVVQRSGWFSGPGSPAVRVVQWSWWSTWTAEPPGLLNHPDS